MKQYIEKDKLKMAIQDAKEGKKINGLVLLKACAALGMMINNAEIIEPKKWYYITFKGTCSYDATIA